MDFSEVLSLGMKKNNIELSEHQIKQFEKYKDLLKEWNEKINLTAIVEDIEIAKKHFIDSTSVIKSRYIKEGSSLVDVGTGAGFPAIPLKIVMPSLKVVLVDSLNKRINFLNTVIEELGLNDIKSVHGRAEDVAQNKDYREKFDIATARAVSNMTVLSEYCIPFVRKGGYFLAMKGPSAEEECAAAKNAIGTLGGKFIDIVKLNDVDDEYNHNVIIVEKIGNTNAKYPRKAGMVEKKPLL